MYMFLVFMALMGDSFELNLTCTHLFHCCINLCLYNNSVLKPRREYLARWSIINEARALKPTTTLPVTYLYV